MKNFSHIDSDNATRAPIPDAAATLAQVYRLLLELVNTKNATAGVPDQEQPAATKLTPASPENNGDDTTNGY